MSHISFRGLLKHEQNSKITKQIVSYVLLLLALIFLFGSTILKYPQVDVQDESIYLDHLIKASRLQLGQAGEYFTDESINEICWRGGQSDHPSVPTSYDQKCSADDRKAAFGINYTTPEPLYFVITGLVARLLSSALGVFGNNNISVVTLGRLLGIVWFLLAIIYVNKSVKLLNASGKLVFPLALGVASLPSIFHEHTIINADASSFALGSILIYFVLRQSMGLNSVWQILVTVTIALLTTSHNIVAVGTVFLFMVIFFASGKYDSQIRRLSEYPQRPRILKAAFGVLLLTVMLTLYWRQVISPLQSWLYKTPDINPAQVHEELRAMYATTGIRWFDIFSPGNIERLVIPYADNFQPFQRFGGPYNGVVTFFVWLLIAGLFAAILANHEYKHVRLLSVSHLFSTVSFSILFILQWNLQGVHDGVVARFGLSSLAVPTIAAAVLFEGRRFSHTAVWGISAFAFGAALLTNFVTWV